MTILNLIFLGTISLLSYIIFSLNILVSCFSFVILIFLISILCLKFQIEYVSYIIVLIYVGGILIFFIFVTLMLSNDFTGKKKNSYWLELVCLWFFLIKSIHFMFYLNYKFMGFWGLKMISHLPNKLSNEFFLDYLINVNDIYGLILLYNEKYIFILILGLLFLLVMIGVVVILIGSSSFGKKINEKD